MRTLKLFLIATVAACATGAPLSQPGSVDIATIQHEIQQVDSHAIVRMGHTTNTTAVVFADDGAGVHLREIWQRDGRTWKLREAEKLRESEAVAH